MRRRAGFTLIELIATLVLVGLLAAVAGMGLVAGVEGYILARQNTNLAQKVQVAGLRLGREFQELSSISSAAADSIVYTNTTGQHGLALVGGTIQLQDGAAAPSAASPGDVLLEDVTNFTLTYYKGGQPWVPGVDNIKDLTGIRLSLTVSHPDADVPDLTFTTTVNPRNTGLKAGPYGYSS
ncbi:MAG: type II secretion system protein [Thermodesulfobacteriota bacterium]